MVHAVTVLAAVLLLAPLIGWLPMSSLAALLLLVAWNMSEAKHFVHTVRVAPRKVGSCAVKDTPASTTTAIMIFMALIEEGKKAPAFSLKDQDGHTHRLSDYAGRPVILYFYPKDDTPGCTKESCEFRDNLPQFKKSKAVVLGISILDEASKKKFADKFDLNFPLLADADHEVAEKYGV